MRAKRWLAIAVVASAAVASHAQVIPQGAKVFLDSCAACHSVGGGDVVGPDLAKVSKWPRADIEKAVTRMQENTGPLTAEQIGALVDLLQAAEAQQRIATAGNPPPGPAAVEIPPEQKAASAATGRRLFFGEQPLANRGVPCAACHAAAGRGGNMAANLSFVHARRPGAALLSTAQQPVFPLMKAAYAAHPVTLQEAYHLVAFLQQPLSPPERGDAVDRIAGGLVLVVFAGVAVLFRARRAGVRSRMVRTSSGGE